MFSRSRVPHRAFALFCLSLAVVAPRATAATITVVPTVVPGDTVHGFDDPTIVAPEGGNTGTTLGQQRRNVFNAAAAEWASALGSNVEIKIAASFTALNCSPASGELGFAVANQYQGLTVSGVTRLYPIALAEALLGGEINGGNPEIIARFNSRIDPVDAGCGGSTRLYYGLSGTPPAGTLALYPAVLHELAHGLGFKSFFCTPENMAIYPSNCAGGAGSYLTGYPDSWSDYLFDTSTGKFFVDMTNAERATAWGNDPNIVWAGPKVTGHLPDFNQSGAVLSQGMMRIHAPAAYDNAASLSHFPSAATPDLLMEAIVGTYTVGTTDLTDCALADLGWINNRCISRAPTLDAIANPAAILEDAGLQTVNLSGIGDADNNTQTLSIAATSGTPAVIPNPAVSYTSRNATGSLSYTPLANQSGSAVIAVTLTDTGDTDGGGLNSRARTFTVNVTPVNDAPTASNLSAPESYTEDTALDLVDIVASDIDSANVTATLTLSSPGAGSLNTATSGAVTSTYVAGTGVWSASGALASVNTLLAGLTFTPALNSSVGFSIATLVSDGALSVPGSKVFTGNAVNDAPTASNLASAETFTEDTPLNLIDIVASDIDSATVTATLTLSSPAAGSFSTGTSGAIFSTFNAGTGTWSASGPLVNVNVLLAGVVFSPAVNSNGTFTVATQVSDGALATGGTKPFTGVAVNDAPTASNLSAPETYTEDSPLNLVDIVAVDVDSAVTATLILSTPAAGSLSTASSGAVTSVYDIGSGTWTASGPVADVNVLLAGVSFAPSANFNATFAIATRVSDGIAAAVTGSKTVTGTPVNDAPTATHLSAVETFTEDTPLDLIDVVAADIDSATVTATLTLSDPAAGSLSTATSGTVTSSFDAGTGTWSANGAIASVNTLLAGVVFTPTANFAANFAVTTSVSDGVATAATGSKSFIATAVNDAPVASNLAAAESYVEDTPLDLVDIVASDIDNATLGATLVLSNPAAGSLSTATSGAVTSTYDAGTGTWSASGATANVNALLAGLVFTPAANANGSFTVATSVSDGIAPALPGTKAFTGAAVDDAPVASNLSAPETYTEDTARNLVDIVVSDIDSSVVTATLTLSSPAVGVLGTATSGSVTSTFSPASGIWSASGATADVNALLAGLEFLPAANFAGNFTIATQVDAGALSVTGNKIVTAIAVNDPPVATAPATAKLAEDATVAFTGTETFSLADADAIAVSVQLSATHGTLSVQASAGVAFTTGDGSSDATMAFNGSVAAVNATLATLVYAPSADYHGSAAVQLTGDDGVAAPVTPPATTITVTPVADIVDDAIDALQNQARSFNAITGANGGSADNFENAGRLLTAATQGAHGAVSFAPDGTLTYTPGAGYVGADQFTYTVSAGGAEESGNVLVSVGAINAAPTLDPIADPATLSNTAGPQTILLTGIGAGAGENQALTLTAVSGNPALVANPTIDYATPAATAVLHFTPQSGATGTALITVTLQDSGGTANGGIDTVTRTFTVTVVSGAPLVFRNGFEGS